MDYGQRAKAFFQLLIRRGNGAGLRFANPIYALANKKGKIHEH